MNFLAGFGLGLALGVLFAPMPGEKLREITAVRAGELADTAREQYQQARDKTEATISAIRGDQAKTGTQG
jgi:hypothetical protein